MSANVAAPKTLPDDYLEYPMRRYGMDHERYEWSMLPQRNHGAWRFKWHTGHVQGEPL